MSAPVADSAPKTVPSRHLSPFFRSFEVRWADLDPNGHLRHSAYGDYATHVRLSILAEHGYSLERFKEERFGAVIFREECVFKREIVLGERVYVDFRVGEMSPCGRKWTVRHHVVKENGKLAAQLTLDGCWFNLDKRRLMRPPQALYDVMRDVEQTYAGVS